MKTRTERSWQRGLLLLAGISVLSAGALSGTTGCLWIFNQEFVEPEFDIRDTYVAVMPFRHQKFWYGETEEGRQVANFIGYKIQAECDAVTQIHAEEAEAALADNVEEPVPWKELGLIAGADYLIYGTIRSLKMRNPQVIAVLSGEMVCVVKVYNVKRDLVEYEREIVVRHPKDPTGGEIEIAFEQNEPTVKRKLYALAGERVTRLLCGWVRDKSDPDDY